MEFRGTPGPWEMKKVKGDQEWFVFQKGSMKKFAGVSIRTPVADEIFNRHNARLISAAPELLEALQGYMSAVERVNAAMTDGINFQGALSALVGYEDLARSAISKALGEV